jgi:hypothetical protein
MLFRGPLVSLSAWFVSLNLSGKQNPQFTATWAKADLIIITGRRWQKICIKYPRKTFHYLSILESNSTSSMWCYHTCPLHIQWDVSLHRVETCSWPTTIQRRCDESSIVSELCLWNCIKVIPIFPTFPDCNEHAIRIPSAKKLKPCVLWMEVAKPWNQCNTIRLTEELVRGMGFLNNHTMTMSKS